MGYTLPPASPSPSPSSSDPRTRALALIAHKDTLSAALAAEQRALAAAGADMSTPLVDAGGFPRADLDVVEVRRARVRVIELRNDLEGVMGEVGRVLEGVFGVGEEGEEREEGEREEGMGEGEEMRPFARVDGVAPGSPAAGAGIQRADLLLKVGPLGASSFASSSAGTGAGAGALEPLAALVGAHENRPLEVRVRRGAGTLTLCLVPRGGWGGRGMLGCHVVPYAET
ncbi:hypothetical protein DFH11DRAFT_1694426 [Phellopilus nigrolimitatus]|nr:hypothetical protein DFH11DRAFT_1694426 [Phellopilus nigrolimitatus]